MSPRERLYRSQLASMRSFPSEPIEDPGDAMVPCPKCGGDPDCGLCQGSGEVIGQEAAEHYQGDWEPNWGE
jgi:hypothetical protein